MNALNNIEKKKFVSPQILVLLIFLAVVFVFFSLGVKDYSYLRTANLNNILTDSVIPAIFGFGMGIIVAGGGFDLSLGHLASGAAVVTGYALGGGIFRIMFDPVTAIAIGLLVALLIGLLNGILVSRFGISSFIVTLGVQFLIIGLRQMFTGGRSIYIGNKAFKALAKSPYGISNLIIVLFIVSALVYIFMERSTFGRKIQFVGSNIEASKFKGINIKNYTMLTFILGALLSGFAGMLFAAKAGAIEINSVDSKLLDAITIAIFSGTLFKRFSTVGIIMVAVLISMISTGMSMMSIRTEWIEFVKGFVLLLSILMARMLGLRAIKKV